MPGLTRSYRGEGPTDQRQAYAVIFSAPKGGKSPGVRQVCGAQCAAVCEKTSRTVLFQSFQSGTRCADVKVCESFPRTHNPLISLNMLGVRGAPYYVGRLRRALPCGERYESHANTKPKSIPLWKK